MAVILITGASSGFGKLTALAFARNGDHVYAGVRDPANSDALARSADDQALAIEQLRLDVTDTRTINTAVDTILREAGRIDVLVNNAGVHLLGALEDMPEDALREVMDTNFFGAVNVTRAVLPVMREQRSGHVIQMSSIGGMIGRVADSIYCASKAALEGASEGLRYEVQPFGINVSMIEPGAFRTELADKFAVLPDYPADSPYRELIQFRAARLTETCKNGDDPQKVADLIVEVAQSAEPAFRYPAGQQAESFLPQLKKMTDAQRADFIREAAKIGWWLDGSERPD